MPANITVALAAALAVAVIALTTSAHAAPNGNRDEGYAPRSAQYCVPQYDSSGAQKGPYC
jgi:hypothetical protein